MVDAATSPCFTVATGGVTSRASLRDLLSASHESTRFHGPDPFLEAMQLFVAASIVADVLGSDGDPDAPLVETAALAVTRMDAAPHRFLLDGEGHRYGQVPLPEDQRVELGVSALEGTFFPGISPAAKTDDRFNFGWRPGASEDGFCPSCALLGLTFVAKCAPGTGGKTAGLWKAGMFTFPVFRSLRDTILVNALAWSKKGTPVPEWDTLDPDEDVDPWADEAYLRAVATSTLPHEGAFRTLKHVRNWTPWALWLRWEHRDGTCTLCGLETGDLAVGATGPVRLKVGYSGKLGWPKRLNKAGILANEVIPTPFTPCTRDGGFASPLFCERTQLLSFAAKVIDLESASIAKALTLNYVSDWSSDWLVPDESRSVLVTVLFNDHKGSGTFTYSTHIPLPEVPTTVAARCTKLHTRFEERTGQLRKGLMLAFTLTTVPTPLLLPWRNVATRFTEFLGGSQEEEEAWIKLLSDEAVVLYDRVTAHMYEAGSHNKVPTAKLAALGRNLVTAIPKPQES